MNEQIVREYFESLGFFVIQPNKYQVAARKKTADEEIDLLVCRPEGAVGELPDTMLWGSAELRTVPKALVSVRGWHTDRFSPAVLDKSPELFRFTDDDVLEKAGAFLGEGPLAKILCISDLPASKTLQAQVLETLRERGVDGVIVFRNILLELTSDIDVKNNYEKSDVLQMLRILKNYDLLTDPQMELFARRRKGSRS
ncbi:MAG: hypothetical protein K9M45_11315 [Kiritimatiellales bacterium]|nr:hypothetical protein [Kiritimatiellales bacterium]